MENRYRSLLAKRDLLKKQLAQKTTQLEQVEKDHKNHIKARAVITELLENSQDKMKKRVGSLVTSAMSSVFNRPYKFSLEFIQKRNKVECVPVITENDIINDDIKYDMGGGILPIISFPLRIVFKTIQANPTRDVIILDEPIKGSLSDQTLDKTISMFNELSKKLGIQLILITHYKELSNVCDKVFQITHDGNKSIVEGDKTDAKSNKNITKRTRTRH